MGNKLESGKNNYKASSSAINSRRNRNLITNTNSARKDGLYVEEKFFENFDNSNIVGIRLDSDPEEREYYINCTQCGKLVLDKGLTKDIRCKQCHNTFDSEETLHHNNKNLRKDIIPISTDDNKINLSNFISLRNNPLFFLLNKKQKKIDELSSVVLTIDRDSLFSSLLYENEKINFDLVVKKLILPYFKIKRRILKKGIYFKIGELDFKVAGLFPGKIGVVTSKTYIHCSDSFSSKTPLNRVLLLTTQQYDNFNPEELVKDLISSESEIIITKNEVTQIKQYEFYIRNCEPESGRIASNTYISIENKDIYNVTKMKIAIIKSNVPQFQNPGVRTNYEEYILSEYFNPFFLSGVKKYIERGDIFKVDDLEMFILNSSPEHGFISQDTNVMFKFGMNKEKCLEKIRRADNEYAMSLVNKEQGLRSPQIFYSEGLPLSFQIMAENQSINLDNILNRLSILDGNLSNILSSSGNEISPERVEMAITNLPTQVLNKLFINNLRKRNADEALKCIICMSNFEEEEIIKTLPCFHIFHCNCVDEWLRSNIQCPICKFPIV